MPKALSRADYLAEPLPIEDELSKLFERGTAITIFEVGACEGLDTVRYARRFPESRVYAFEPVPKNVAEMKALLAEQAISNVEVIAAAVSDSNEPCVLHLSSTADGFEKKDGDWDYGNKSSSLLAPAQHLDRYEFVAFKETITVPSTTLRRFCDERSIGVVDFLHMDVQGAELRVLEGADMAAIGAIWLEVSKIPLYDGQPLVKDVESFMKRHGFVCFTNKMGKVQGDQLYLNERRFRVSRFPRRITRLENPS
jgi:FkbM family methyltransferase